MERINDYTLIIPTYSNRAHLLRKLVDFLALKKVEFDIIVVDSSENSVKKKNRDVCGKSKLAITYFEYPSEIAPVPKVLDGLKHVKTRYVSLCADDDLIFIDAIPECLNFLEAATDYIACHGNYLNYGDNENEGYDIGLEYDAPSLDGETFEERAFQLLNNYQSIFYAIFRTDVLVDYVKSALNIAPFAYLELFSGIAPLVKGKVKRLPLCYYVRARHTSTRSHDNRWHPNLWFADNPDGLVQEFIKYREILKKFIDERSGHKIEDLNKLLSLLHAIYFFKSFDLSYIQGVLKRDFKINLLTAQKGKMAFIPSLHHIADMIYRRIFSGECLVRRKSNPKGSITFKIPKSISRSVVSQSVLIDLENYLLGVDAVQ